MRKTLILAVTALLALFATTSLANAQEPQQIIKTKLTPTKLDKKKYKPAKIFVDVETGPNDENPALQQPPKANRTIVDFPKNMKFDTKAVPNCAVTNTAISNRTGEQATEMCGKKAKVGSGTATVQVGTGPTSSIDVPAKITALNGNSKNQIYLHSDPEGIPTKPVLVGKLKKGPTGFGKSLDVTIPPLQAGAISNFETTVKAGKYVQARCKSKKNPFRARSFYEDHSPTTTPVFETKCKRKKKK